MKDSTDITVLLDRTGSMIDQRAETISGFNAFLKEQREVPGDALFTMVQFDATDPFEVLYSAVPIDSAKELTEETFVPRGMTPLFDSFGRLIVSTGERLSAIQEEDRPSKVILVVITDGLDNSSTEYTRERVKTMVEEQEKTWNWHVVFLGANIDAVAEGHLIGVSAAAAMSYAPASAKAAYVAVSSNVAQLRKGIRSRVSFTARQRAAAMGRRQ